MQISNPFCPDWVSLTSQYQPKNHGICLLGVLYKLSSIISKLWIVLQNNLRYVFLGQKQSHKLYSLITIYAMTLALPIQIIIQPYSSRFICELHLALPTFFFFGKRNLTRIKPFIWVEPTALNVRFKLSLFKLDLNKFEMNLIQAGSSLRVQYF